jgi:hypothetical protein
MTAAKQEATGGPSEPEVIRPGPDVEKPLNVTADAQEMRRRPPSPTERYEARVDRHIADLQRAKQQLEEEIRRLRDQEIHHLREDVRWLEDFNSGQSRELVKTQTCYASAIAFNWLSFALIAIGGCVVSYATFVHPQAQMTIATAALVGLFIGVAVQAFNSWVGTRLFLGKTEPPGADSRPRPNPRPMNEPGSSRIT